MHTHTHTTSHPDPAAACENIGIAIVQVKPLGTALVPRVAHCANICVAPHTNEFDAFDLQVELHPLLPEDCFGAHLRVQEKVQCIADNSLFLLRDFVELQPTALPTSQRTVK
eukprot:5396170-Pyramimonas_sp.AAC.1